jgi:hypothetical protein
MPLRGGIPMVPCYFDFATKKMRDKKIVILEILTQPKAPKLLNFGVSVSQ